MDLALHARECFRQLLLISFLLPRKKSAEGCGLLRREHTRVQPATGKVPVGGQVEALPEVCVLPTDMNVRLAQFMIPAVIEKKLFRGTSSFLPGIGKEYHFLPEL